MYKNKTKPVSFGTHDEMLQFLHRQWPALKAKHDLVVEYRGQFGAVEVVDDSSLRELFNRIGGAGGAAVNLHVNMNSHGFSWYAKHHAIALEKTHSSDVLESEFQLDNTISEMDYEAATDQVCHELLRRVRILDLQQASEYTMRELISPVLIGALCLVDDINERSMETRVRLICEKLISGTSGHGPVEYVVSYLNVYIVIGEAKHQELLNGLYQNLVQQCNALESLADKIVGSAVVGVKRSRDFIDIYADLRNSLSTCGITSTGKEWLFSRTEKDPSDASKVIIRKSPIYMLTAAPTATITEIAAMKTQVRVLLQLIVHMIVTQKDAVNSHPRLNTRPLQSRLDSEEKDAQIIAQEALLALSDDPAAQNENDEV